MIWLLGFLGASPYAYLLEKKKNLDFGTKHKLCIVLGICACESGFFLDEEGNCHGLGTQVRAKTLHVKIEVKM